MPSLLVVGGGLFGSQAAAYARRQGIEAIVFDPTLLGAASPAAAGLFKEAWAGKKLQEHFQRARVLLEQLYGIRHVSLRHDDATTEPFLFVRPTATPAPPPILESVPTVADGWREPGGR